MRCLLSIGHSPPQSSRSTLRLPFTCHRSERNLVFDSMTGAPVPQRLAIRQKARTAGGVATSSLIRRLTPQDANDSRTSLLKALEKVGRIDAKNFSDLADQLRSEQDAALRREGADTLSLRQIVGRAISYAEASQTQSPRSFIAAAAAILAERQEHFRYLQKLKLGHELLAQMEKRLDEDTRDLTDQLITARRQIDFLEIDPTHATLVQVACTNKRMRNMEI